MKKTVRYLVFTFLACAPVAFAGFAGDGAAAPPRAPVVHTWLRPEMRLLTDTLANHITDSAGVLTPFFGKLAALRSGNVENYGDRMVSILHIGDSHVQAGTLTGRLRELFQADFGDAGRGLIVPSKLAGMNEPRDYAIVTRYRHKALKATDAAAAGAQHGPTGVAVTFETPYNELRIWSKSPFDAVTVLHAGGAPPPRYADSLDIGSYCDIDNTPVSTRLVLNRAVDSLMLYGMKSDDFPDPTYYGFSLENGGQGVIYHSLGLNGAAFEHFMNRTKVVDGGMQPLEPDLIIISLGTNNCFGANFRGDQLRGVVDRFLARVAESYPGVPLLVTTPMECCVRRRTGGRRAYVPNANIAVAGRVIADAASAVGAASWDLYAAAGGEGSMARWFEHGLAGADRVHLTESGYQLQGDMLYEALAECYNRSIGEGE